MGNDPGNELSMELTVWMCLRVGGSPFTGTKSYGRLAKCNPYTNGPLV